MSPWWLAAVGPLLLGPVWAWAWESSRWADAPIATTAGLVALLLVMISSGTDLARRKIPNWATYSALLWSVPLNVVESLSLTHAPGLGVSPGGPVMMWADRVGVVGWGDGLLGALVCFALMMMPFRLAGGGAGDVKLATALGGLLGVQRGVDALILSYLCGGVVLGGWLIWTLGPVAVVGGIARVVGSILFPGWVARPTLIVGQTLTSPVPLAVFFAVGTLAVLTGWGIDW